MKVRYTTLNTKDLISVPKQAMEEAPQQPIMRVKCKVLLNSTMLEEKFDVGCIEWTEKLHEEDYFSISGAPTPVPNNIEQPDESPVITKSEVISQKPQIPKDCWENVEYYSQYWELCEEEHGKLLHLGSVLSDVKDKLNRPHLVVRFLRFLDFDMEKAETAFRDMIQWRQENNVDNILDDYHPPALLLEKYPGAILKGTDKEGDPVFLSRMGATDLFGLVDRFGHEELIRYEIYKREASVNGSWRPAWEMKSGRPVKQITIIEDLYGLCRRHMSSKVAHMFKDAMQLDQMNYPDTSKKIIIIRAPAIFRLIWSIAKNFFAANVVKKMDFCGENDYLQVLEKYMDLDILPPCVNPTGTGEAVAGMPPNFEGGLISS